MNEKWKVRKGYLKIHVAVNVKSKKILSMKVTDEHVHDGKALPELVDNVIKPNKITAAVGKLFADGAYDSNDIFRCLVRQWNPALYQTKKECESQSKNWPYP